MQYYRYRNLIERLCSALKDLRKVAIHDLESITDIVKRDLKDNREFTIAK